MVRSRRILAVLAAAVVALVSLTMPSPAFADSGNIVGSAVSPTGNGYWLVKGNGDVVASNGARHFGDVDGYPLNKPIVGMASTPSGNGYWLVATDGGIFAYGDAAFYGSTGSIALNMPVVGMSATASGHGYWLVASDGGIFAYGDAGFYGSTGSMKLNKPIVGMGATTSGHGYWLVASDGGIFSFGDAGFYGSTGSIGLNKPVVGMAASKSGAGYWLAAADGGIFAFGDAAFRGSGAGEVRGNIATFVPETTGGYVIVDSRGKLLRFPGASQSSAPPASAPSTGSTSGNHDLPGWKFKFGDDFHTNAASGSFLNTYKNWGAYDTGWPDTSHRGMYDTDALSVSNGIMNINLHTGVDGKPRSAVPFPLINGRGSNDETNQLYGRYEVRFRADAVEGYKSAFLLWPESEVWPRDGEIDFPEGNFAGGRIEAFMHRQGGTFGGDQDAFETNATFQNWHTAIIEWSPHAVRFFLDGTNIGTSTDRIPNTPMHWVLQTETNLEGKPIPASANGNVQIDYVKVWSYKP